jgi:predicted unusual protein kinase regulating ubiquinone biosynthesis (AarF/ABC1/UbiB family)
MPEYVPRAKGLAVPQSRLSRLARFGSLASGVAGGMVASGIHQLAQGKRPRLSDLLLTPANVMRVTDQLAQLRGAAMKLGQLLSLDAGDLLPPELSQILSRLRADAQHMPQRQLMATLNAQWGKGWEDRFAHFSFAPLAAASIGQVHRATTKDGRDLAIKVQYPDIGKSIDSDVNNVAALLRLSGLLPETLDVKPLLAEAKRQLHEEADYLMEADHLARFADLLGNDPGFQVPDLHRDLTRRGILAMSYVEGVPIESLSDAPQEVRDRVMTQLIDLLLRELFDFGVMQTDPNFANYRYDPKAERIILLDFGATRAFAPQLADDYRTLLSAILEGQPKAITQNIIALGLLGDKSNPTRDAEILALVDIVMEPLRAGGLFDFGKSDMSKRLRDRGLTLAADRSYWHIPPVDILFLQRKFGGMFLLATQLKARVPVSDLLRRYGDPEALTRNTGRMRSRASTAKL